MDTILRSKAHALLIESDALLQVLTLHHVDLLHEIQPMAKLAEGALHGDTTPEAVDAAFDLMGLSVEADSQRVVYRMLKQASEQLQQHYGITENV